MNTQKADNPLIEMYKVEMAALREEVKAAREDVKAAQATPPKGLADQLLEFATLADKLEPVKKLFGFGGGGGPAAAAESVRVSRTTGLDIVRDFVTSPTAEHIGRGLGNLLNTFAQHQQPNPGNTMVNQPPPPQQPQQETERDRIIRIAQTITGPMLHQYFLPGEDGDTFAGVMFDMWPEDYMFMRALGAPRILELYKNFPPAWAIIAPKEAAFLKFLNELCAWKPDVDEEPAKDDGIIDAEVEVEPEVV